MAGRRPANHKEKTPLSHSINLAPVRRQPWGHNVTCKSQIKLNCPKLPSVKTPSPQSCLPCLPLSGSGCKKTRLIGVQVSTVSRLWSGQFVRLLVTFSFMHVFHATKPLQQLGLNHTTSNPSSLLCDRVLCRSLQK